MTAHRKAISDIISTLKQPRLWVLLGWRDVQMQFERTRLGPFWMTLQAAAWIGAVIFVFAGIMAPPREYAVYVAVGIVLYNFITVIVTDSSELFIRNRIVIHSHPNPYFSYILRQVAIAVIQLGLQSLMIVLVFAIARYPVGIEALLVIPGLMLGIIMGVTLTTLFSLLGLRYGDFKFSMLAIMRLGLFITPILWMEEGGGWMKRLAADINPMAHFIDLIRMPLLGDVPPMSSYLVAIGCVIITGYFGWKLFARQRSSIPMWI